MDIWCLFTSACAKSSFERGRGRLYKIHMTISYFTPSRWASIALLGVLTLSPLVVYAGTSPEEMKKFEEVKAKAEKGDAEAQNLLGLSYISGRGVATDAVQAVFWWRKAAEQGFAVAQYNMGQSYAYGDGVAKDSSQAVSWWRKAAELGYADAQYNLGYYYANGLGVVQDYVKAVLWYRKAAEQGNASAQYYLGVCYFNSAGVAQDNVHAVYWTRKAAEQGNETAQLSLGWCYYNGEGVAKDVVEAYAYFSLAGKAHALGSKHLGFIESEISAAKIAAGKKRTIELQKEIEAKIAAKKAGK